jgi:hypothetical protein
MGIDKYELAEFIAKWFDEEVCTYKYPIDQNDLCLDDYGIDGQVDLIDLADKILGSLSEPAQK